MKGVTISTLARLRQIVCCLALVGCATQSPVGAMDITGINYTDTYVSLFTVNGYPGPNVMPYSGGGICLLHLCSRGVEAGHDRDSEVDRQAQCQSNCLENQSG